MSPFVVTGDRVDSGGSGFDSNIFNYGTFGGGYGGGGGAGGGIGGVGGEIMPPTVTVPIDEGTVNPPVTISIGDGTPKQDEIPYTGGSSGDPLIDKIAAEEIARQNAIRESQGLPPLTEATANQRTLNADGTTGPSPAEKLAEHVVRELPKVFEAEDANAAAAARTAARASAATGNSGIPLIIPIPGINPATGLAITAAGLIFSGGNVAKLDPKDPIGSVVNAGQGTVNTVTNAADVLTGQKDISDIWGTGSTGGGAGTGTGAGTGSITGGQNEVIGLDPSGLGAIGVVSTGGGSGGGQPSGGGSNVSVTPGSLGGAITPLEPPSTPSIPIVAGVTQPVTTPTAPGVTVLNPPTEVEPIDPNAGIFSPPAVVPETPKILQPDVKPPAIAPNAGIFNTTAPATTTTGTGTSTGTNQTTTTSTGPVVVGTGTGETPTTTSTTTVTTTGTGPSTGGGAATMPIVTTPSFNFTSPTNTGLAQRDYGKEFGLTAQTLTGQPGDDLAAYYKKLQEQFTPSSLTTLGREAESQLAADMARYTEAQKGNLSQEDVRTAQQGAREAYAARGQVMGQGAIGAEILGRDALQRQREAEARASVQQSMGNLSRAADLQTGNIFSPFASLISQTYSPTNQYAREVYDYNVNAYNAYQAAEKNLAAYKEAASKGQEAQFINSFVGFLANNGIQTTTNAVTSIINGLLGGGAKKPAGT